MKFIAVSVWRISSASCEDVCLFTQDYAGLSRFINKNRKNIYSDRSFYRSRKQKHIIFAARRVQELFGIRKIGLLE